MGVQATYTSVSASNIDSRNAGDLTLRDVSFDKVHSSTRLRLLYSDNLRIAKASTYCVYELKIDGATCQSGMIQGALYGGNGNNEHVQHTIEGYCDGVPAGSHTLTVGLSGNSDECYTGWWFGPTQGDFYLEAQERPVSDPYLHTKQAIQVSDSANSGYIRERDLSFNKVFGETRLRITYHDNFRNMVTGGATCNWEIHIDGGACPSGRLVGMRHSTNLDNTHMPETILGVCDGVAAGMHTLSVMLTSNNGADCYTGWAPTGSAQFVLEAEEHLVEDPYLTSITGRSTSTAGSSGVDALVPGRALSFEKLHQDSRIRISYYDNMRAMPSTAHCSWSVFVDGQECPSGPIKTSLYQGGEDNDHYFHTLVGSCEGLSAGPHSLTVSVHSNSLASCYSGWDGSKQHFYLEAFEVK